MSLKDIALAARRRWVAVVASALVGLLVGLALALLTPQQYSARTFVYVAGQATDDGSAYEGSLLAEQKARAYSEIVSSGSFPTKVAATAGGDASEVGGQLSVSTQSDSSLIEVVATDPSPQRSAVLADAGAGVVVELVGALERPAPNRPSTVTATLVEPAIIPSGPSSTEPSTYVALGLVLGLIAGLALAVVWSALDTTITDSTGLADLTDGPVLGSVPRDPGGGNLVADPDRLSAVAEAFRQIRTSLGFVAITRKLHTVMVTSAVEGEGKSSTASGLALVLAQQGRRVLVVDADLRRPHLAELFGLPGEVGLTNVLLGQLSLEQAVQSGADGQVSVLARGTAPPNPADLLTSPAFDALLQRLRAQYDVVVLDTPPLLPVADAAIMAARCDGVILVVRSHRTSGRLVSEAVQRLRDASATCLGSVLTMARADVDKYRRYTQTVDKPSTPPAPAPPARSLADDEPGTVQDDKPARPELPVTTSELFVERYRPRPGPRQASAIGTVESEDAAPATSREPSSVSAEASGQDVSGKSENSQKEPAPEAPPATEPTSGPTPTSSDEFSASPSSARPSSAKPSSAKRSPAKRSPAKKSPAKPSSAGPASMESASTESGSSELPEPVESQESPESVPAGAASLSTVSLRTSPWP